MEPPTVLVADAPRAYRDALARALAALRPDLRVEPRAPAALDAALDRPRRPLVVCSRLTPRVEARACAWILLYPGHEPLAIVHGPDGGRVVRDPDLADLLGAIRTAAGSCGSNGGPDEGSDGAIARGTAAAP